MKKKIHRDRGTNLATGISLDLSDDGQPSDDSRRSKGESTVRDGVSQNEMTNIPYLAGLMDGEGCVTYKKYWSSKRKNRPKEYYCWRIQLEIVMTDKDTIQWCCDTFGGNLCLKPRKNGYKMQYRWRRGFRDAYKIAKEIHPYAITKKEKLKNIIDHYELLAL